MNKSEPKADKAKRDEPLSLHPLTPEEALRRAMSSPPPKAEPKGVKKSHPKK